MRAWTAPDVFDIDRDRTEAQNLGFGYGIHSCLGAALALPSGQHAEHVPDWANVRVRILR